MLDESKTKTMLATTEEEVDKFNFPLPKDDDNQETRIEVPDLTTEIQDTPTIPTYTPVTFTENVSAIFLSAESPNQFEGYELYQVLVDEGLVFGDQDIFHYFNQHTASLEHVFSVTQANASGSFDIDNFGSKAYAGLCFVVNHNAKFKDNLQLMLQKAVAIAEVLHANLYTEEKQLITDIQAYADNTSMQNT